MLWRVESSGVMWYGIALCCDNLYVCVCSGITFDPIRYASFIDLQDKLHQNIGR